MPAETRKKTSNNNVFMTPWKGLGIGFLGAILSVAMAIPLSIALHRPSSQISTTTVVTTTTTASTSTTVLTTSTTTTTITTTTTTTSTASTTATTITTTTTTTTTTTINNVTSCVFPCLCSGIASYTLWQPYPNTGIYMTINTSSCNFNRTPVYFTGMGGIGSHNFLSGYGAIYAASNTAFTVYTMSVLFWNTSTLLNLASSDAWNVYWFGLYN